MEVVPLLERERSWLHWESTQQRLCREKVGWCSSPGRRVSGTKA